jgi:hypothetical protein
MYLTEHRATKIYGWSEGMAPPNFNLGTTLERSYSVTLLMTFLSFPGKFWGSALNQATKFKFNF